MFLFNVNASSSNQTKLNETALNFAPVACGETDCTYDNECIAESAGFNLQECCPVSGGNVACPDNFAPVVCGDNECEYS